MAVRKTAWQWLDREYRLMEYLESLVGKPCDYQALDCYRFIQGWATKHNLPAAHYKGWREGYRTISQWGGREFHKGLDFVLARRKPGMELRGDVCYRVSGKIPFLGIYAGGGKGYFLRHEADGEVPYMILPCETDMIWRVD